MWSLDIGWFGMFLRIFAATGTSAGRVQLPHVHKATLYSETGSLQIPRLHTPSDHWSEDEKL